MQIQKYQAYQWNWSLFVILGLCVIGIGVSAMNSAPELGIAATMLYICGGVMIMAGLIYMLPSTNFLEIEEEGFSYRSGWQRVFCKWDECSEFSPWRKTAFGFTATELVTFDSKNPSAQAKSNIKTTGQNASLPGTYGLAANDLAQEMNRFRAMQISRQEKPAQTFL